MDNFHLGVPQNSSCLNKTPARSTVNSTEEERYLQWTEDRPTFRINSIPSQVYEQVQTNLENEIIVGSTRTYRLLFQS
jgi:hypothetical protein